MNTAEITCRQQVLEEQRAHKIPHMSDCYNITSRQELLLVIKGLLDALQKKDPSLRAKTAKVRPTGVWKSCCCVWIYRSCNAVLERTVSHAASLSFSWRHPTGCARMRRSQSNKSKRVLTSCHLRTEASDWCCRTIDVESACPPCQKSKRTKTFTSFRRHVGASRCDAHTSRTSLGKAEHWGSAIFLTYKVL